MSTPSQGSLAALEQQLRREQEVHAYPATSWVGARESSVTGDAAATVGVDEVDVLVVGGGQAGLTSAGKLLREGVPRVLVVDAAPAGAEGPWDTWARMETLRTVKDLHGPDLGHPSATFRAWYTAQHGEAAWDALGLIPRRTWMDYLRWIRHVFAVPYRSGHRVVGLAPVEGDPDGGWHVTLAAVADPAAPVRVRARRVLVTTGIDGVGGPVLPAAVDGLPRHLWSHSSDAIDVAALAGRRVAVLGLGASAFDNAAAVLEAGAAAVVQFGRRPELPTLNSARVLESRALFRHHPTLPDDVRAEITRGVLSLPMPPPDHSVARCRRHDAYELRLGSAWTQVRADDDGAGVLVEVAGAWEQFDHVILGTGFRVDLTAVPWLADVAADVVTWGDRLGLTPSDASVDGRLARYPYLDGGLACQGRTERSQHHLRHLFMLNAAALASAGGSAAGINALPWGTDTVVAGITRSLLEPTLPGILAALAAAREAELTPVR